MGFESTLEKDFFLLLEFDRRVISFEEQPVTITYLDGDRRVCHYTPDVLVHYQSALPIPSDEQPVLYEVKYTSDLREHGLAYRSKFKAARRYAFDQGWRFRVVTERTIRTTRLNNLRFLLRYHRLRIDEGERHALLSVLREHGPVQLDTLLTLVRPARFQRAETLTILWHLVATEQIDVELDQPLTPQSLLRWGRADFERYEVLIGADREIQESGLD